MCKTTLQTAADYGGFNISQPPTTKNVVVVGAGPAGLLMVLQFLERNAKCAGNVQYKVTLVDANKNYGELDEAALKANHRSWMIGLASHGLNAIRNSQVPNLYDKYVSNVGIPLKSGSIFLGSKEIRNQIDQNEETGEGYIVDRNFIVAALARCLTEQYSNNAMLEMKYYTKVLFVDADNQRVLVRTCQEDGHEETEEYLPYDLIVGCDGYRSAVRECLVRNHREFECDVGDIFTYFKAVHVQRPKAVLPESLTLLPSCLPLMQGIALPEQGDLINLSMGVPRSSFDAMHSDMKSSDPKIVADYMRQNFKAFELVDYEDFAKQWINQRWNRTGQVHCNTYHSSEHNIVIMGDAAHATSPSIGMGMNTALSDARAFHELLDKNKDDLSLVLPAFSEERVKEGNALTDLAFNMYCLNPRAQMVETLHMVVRTTLNKWLPFIISQHPQQMLGLTRFKLSDVYRHASKLGVIAKHRYLNDLTRRQFFEQQCGLTPESKDSSWLKFAGAGALFAFATAFVWQLN